MTATTAEASATTATATTAEASATAEVTPPPPKPPRYPPPPPPPKPARMPPPPPKLRPAPPNPGETPLGAEGMEGRCAGWMPRIGLGLPPCIPGCPTFGRAPGIIPGDSLPVRSSVRRGKTVSQAHPLAVYIPLSVHPGSGSELTRELPVRIRHAQAVRRVMCPQTRSGSVAPAWPGPETIVVEEAIVDNDVASKPVWSPSPSAPSTPAPTGRSTGRHSRQVRIRIRKQGYTRGG